MTVQPANKLTSIATHIDVFIEKFLAA